jgi:hypothetical protein
LAEATASGSVVSGFCTEVTFMPAACRRGITSVQHEPSANRPCTSTTLRAFGGVVSAANARVEIIEAAAVASIAAEKLRRFMVVLLFSWKAKQAGMVFIIDERRYRVIHTMWYMDQTKAIRRSCAAPTQ